MVSCTATENDYVCAAKTHVFCIFCLPFPTLSVLCCSFWFGFVVFCLFFEDKHLIDSLLLPLSPSCPSSSPTLQSGAGLLHSFVERPKQRRHRCKDPTKLDINSLTGEERVPVVHRGTGRRVENTHTHTVHKSGHHKVEKAREILNMN